MRERKVSEIVYKLEDLAKSMEKSACVTKAMGVKEAIALISYIRQKEKERRNIMRVGRGVLRSVRKAAAEEEREKNNDILNM
jgi:phosphotransacetylase